MQMRRKRSGNNGRPAKGSRRRLRGSRLAPAGRRSRPGRGSGKSGSLTRWKAECDAIWLVSRRYGPYGDNLPVTRRATMLVVTNCVPEPDGGVTIPAMPGMRIPGGDLLQRPDQAGGGGYSLRSNAVGCNGAVRRTMQ